MSNFNEYISKLECARSLRQTIEQLNILLQHTECEYRFWARQSNLPRWITDQMSGGIDRLIDGAIRKHHDRERLAAFVEKLRGTSHTDNGDAK